MGPRCELNNPCATQPCGPGSLCVPKIDGYMCNCSEQIPGSRYDVHVAELCVQCLHLYQS